MRILITGANGQLGAELQDVLAAHTLVLFPSPEFDLLGERVEAQVQEARPDVVIHAAAYTDVDKAEQERDLVYAVNVEGTESVARAAAACRARLFYISTDYVFDGHKQAPYCETDTPNPINVYGRSKLEGERRALALCPDTLVVRTARLYGAKPSCSGSGIRRDSSVSTFRISAKLLSCSLIAHAISVPSDDHWGEASNVERGSMLSSRGGLPPSAETT